MHSHLVQTLFEAHFLSQSAPPLPLSARTFSALGFASDYPKLVHWICHTPAFYLIIWLCISEPGSRYQTLLPLELIRPSTCCLLYFDHLDLYLKICFPPVTCLCVTPLSGCQISFLSPLLKKHTCWHPTGPTGPSSAPTLPGLDFPLSFPPFPGLSAPTRPLCDCHYLIFLLII